MPRLAINILEEELDEAAAFCERSGVGAEVTAFAWPSGLEDGFMTRVRRHTVALAEVPVASCHGPFLDLYPASRDPLIVDVCRQRHRRALLAARELSATCYVAHVNSIPLIRSKAYVDDFVGRTVDFWLPLAEEWGCHDITIVLENLWERGPDVQRAIVEAADHPRLKASFDNGHALIHSSTPSNEWVEALGDNLTHCHLHDNDGSYDSHRPVGEGIESWEPLLAALASHAPNAHLVLESDRLAENRTALSALRAWLEDV
jgi:sugar phosphate isomerase/epimerase